MSKAELVKLVREKSYEKRNVTLASGRASDFYIDLKNVLLHPLGIDWVSTLILNQLKKYEGELEGVGGPTMGADPMVTACSLKSLEWSRPLMAFYIRKEAKAHGTSQWVEGIKNFSAGAKVFILEDVVTSGGSSLKAVERAKEAGLEVLGIHACVDRQEGGREKIQAAGLQFMTLLTKSDILG
jgi:orotate phosphoribosyltransferase